MANIAEILSNYPLGTQLYSPAFGRVRLKKIRPHLAVIVTDEQGEDWEMLKWEYWYDSEKVCALFMASLFFPITIIVGICYIPFWLIKKRFNIEK